MYAGIAAGKRRAHSKKPLKKKSYLFITQAQEIPIKSDTPPTPIIKIKVLEKYKINLVLKRCVQVSRLFLSDDNIKTKMGVKSKIIKIYAEIFQKLRLFVIFKKDKFNFMILYLKSL